MMMTQFDTCFRLLVAFCILVCVDVNQVTAQRNFTRSPLLALRQLTQQPQHTLWESPVLMPLMNHAWKRNAIAAEVTSKNQQMPQLQQQQIMEAISNIADTITSSVLHFALNVGSELSENAYFSKSEVFSPLSIMSALALLMAGARGRSYQQLRQIFDYDLGTVLSNDSNYAQMLHREFGLLLQDIEQDNISKMHQRQNAKWRDTPERANIRSQPHNQKPVVHILKVANGLFTQKGYSVNLNYKDVIRIIYKSELVQLDFQNDGEAARHYINSWSDKNTFGKIKSVLNNAIPQSTNMILVSALYFKGFWENTFFEAATILDNFYPEGEGQPAIKVPMMATGGVFPYYEAPEYDCRVIGLPYRGNLSTMYVIQPRQSSRAKLKDFQSKITPEAIEDMISKMAYRSAVMAFPKLHIVRQLNLKEILQRFGVSDIFSRLTSDLSLVSDTKLNTNLAAASHSNILPPRAPINRPWHGSRPDLRDRYNESPLFFSSRFGEIGNSSKLNINNQTTLKLEDENSTTTTMTAENLTTTTTQTPIMENPTNGKSRNKRHIPNGISSLSALEEQRFSDTPSQSDLYVDDILHKVDFEVNEHGTEAAAVTLTYLRRSGTDVVFRCDTPFMLLLRHDPSKLVLFYATVNEPEI